MQPLFLNVIIFLIYKSISKIFNTGQVQWLKPVILALQGAEMGRSPKVRSSRPAWKTW